MTAIAGDQARTLCIVCLAVIAALVTPCVSLHAQRDAPSQPERANPPTAGYADSPWPRTFTTASGATLVVHEPQIALWVEQRRMKLYAVVSYAAGGAAAPALGTVQLEADTVVGREERLVRFAELTMTDGKFPTLPAELFGVLVDELTSVPAGALAFALDAGTSARPGEVDDLYAGRDGNVFRSVEGGWLRYNRGSWETVQGSAPGASSPQAAGTTGQVSRQDGVSAGPALVDSRTLDQLNRDRARRVDGTSPARAAEPGQR